MSDLWNKYIDGIAPYIKYVSPRNFDYSVNISLLYKYVYIETPKVGCSSIKTILQRMEIDDPDFYREDFDDVHDRAFSPLLKPSQIGSFTRLLEEKKFFVFCFVRNPYTRLLSSYLDKILGNKHQKQSILLHKGYDLSKINRHIPFEEFIDIVCEQPIMYMDAHWRPQYYQVQYQNIKYSFVGHFESFEKDLMYALGKINTQFMKYWEKEVRHSTNTKELLTDYYTDDLKRKVFLKYEKDFEAFGYDKDSFV